MQLNLVLSLPSMPWDDENHTICHVKNVKNHVLFVMWKVSTITLLLWNDFGQNFTLAEDLWRIPMSFHGHGPVWSRVQFAVEQCFRAWSSAVLSTPVQDWKVFDWSVYQAFSKISFSLCVEIKIHYQQVALIYKKITKWANIFHIV